jgi:hypothetical protein
VAGGDLNGDGFAEIITGAGAGGGPHVKVFDGQTGIELGGFFAYSPGFRGGVTVGAGNANGDGLVDIVTGAGPGGGPHVKWVEGTSFNQLEADGQIASSALLGSFFAFDLGFRGGVFVTAGADLNGDGLADAVVGAGQGGGPHVRAVDSTQLSAADADGVIASSAQLGNFFAFEPTFRGGVRVGEADALQDGVTDLIFGAGPGGGPRVEVRRPDTLADVLDFFAFVPEFTGGVFVD